MKGKVILLCVLVAAVFSQGCASIVSKTNREVALRSYPKGATVTITDKRGKEVFEGATPTTVRLKTGGPYSTRKYAITVSKDGYETENRIVKSAINGWYFGNLFFGGLIGLCVVDPLTGAMWTLSPRELDVTLTAVDASPSTPSASVQPISATDVAGSPRGASGIVR
jgi:hypothetical protein